MTEESTIIEQTKKRSFGGKLGDFASKNEYNHEKKHLKAYLKGFKHFRDGYYTNNHGFREENWFDVIEIWK